MLANGPQDSVTRLFSITRATLPWLVAVISLTAGTASAATLDERSPMAQGAWWDSTRSGSGFEIFSHGNQVGVVWYTFSPEGKPVWYLAQGDLTNVAQQDWPLRRYRWTSGSGASSEEVGTLKLAFSNPESAKVTWRIQGNSGTWSIEPLRLSGVVNEVDRSGAWHDPASSGWGLSIIEQGKLLAAAVYTYDEQGDPTWLSGHDNGTRSKVDLWRYSGSCPWCTYRAPVTSAAGSMQINLQAETRLSLSPQFTQAAGIRIPSSSAQLTQLSRPASARAADRQLARFSSDAQLKQYLDAGMLNLYPAQLVSTGITGITFSSAPPGSAPTPVSVANLQEAGVDEADTVRNNGNRLWTFSADSTGNTLPRLRTALVTDQGNGLTVTGEYSLKAAPASMAKAGLYLTPERLVSVTGNSFTVPSNVADVWTTSSLWRNGVTEIEILDSRTDGLVESLWHGRINGTLIASRRVGDRLYVVTRHVPEVMGFNYLSNSTSALAANRTLLSGTPLSNMVPMLSINSAPAQPLIQTGNLFAPPQGMRALSPDVFAVTAIALDRPAVTGSLGVMGIMDTVYASTKGLFLVGGRSIPRSSLPSMQTVEPPYYSDVHFIRFDNGGLSHAGTGTVEGYVDQKGNNTPLRLSELNGQLRIVTSSSSMWNNQNRNRLTVLEPSTATPGLLRTVSFLPNESRPSPLGKPGELLFATRFDGDKLYAVTFRRVDPLYVVDLANPADPVIKGELEVVGYSDYLHPLPNGLLLGVGRDARSVVGVGDGPGVLFQGLQLSLYDVSNPQKPRELRKLTMGQRGSTSPVLSNHLAFTTRRLEDGSLDIAFPGVIHQGTGSLSMSTNPDLATQPWHHTGLLRFRLFGSTPQDANLMPADTFVTVAAAGPYGRASDREARTARSILFPKGEVYINDGRFWLRRADGSTLMGE